MAIPTIFYSLEHPDNFDTGALQDVLYVWGGDRARPWRKYNPQISAFHPWKTTSLDQMRAILIAMSKGDPTLRELIPRIPEFPQ